MLFPKPKSVPGIFLYGTAIAAVALIARVAWVLIGQNVESLSSEKGYDKLLTKHWSFIVDWMTSHMFVLSTATAFVVGGALFSWAYALIIDKFAPRPPVFNKFGEHKNLNEFAAPALAATPKKRLLTISEKEAAITALETLYKAVTVSYNGKPHYSPWLLDSQPGLSNEVIETNARVAIVGLEQVLADATSVHLDEPVRQELEPLTRDLFSSLYEYRAQLRVFADRIAACAREKTPRHLVSQMLQDQLNIASNARDEFEKHRGGFRDKIEGKRRDYAA
jgi:hypothetical protein